MANDFKLALREGSLATFRYRVDEASYHGTIVFTWGSLDAETPAALFAKSVGATAYGLITFEDMPNTPRLPMLWRRTDVRVEICAAPADEPLGDLLRVFIEERLRQFFDDIIRMCMSPVEEGSTKAH